MSKLIRILVVLALCLAPSLAFAVANTSPVFSLTPNITVGKSIATANTATDGTGTVVTIWTSGANGGRVDRCVWQPLGTNVATVGRIFVNNGSTNTTATNNSYVVDVTLAASTLSQVASMPSTTAQMDLVLPAGYVLNTTVGTTVAAGYLVTCFGGNY